MGVRGDLFSDKPDSPLTAHIMVYQTGDWTSLYSAVVACEFVVFGTPEEPAVRPILPQNTQAAYIAMIHRRGNAPMLQWGTRDDDLGSSSVDGNWKSHGFAEKRGGQGPEIDELLMKGRPLTHAQPGFKCWSHQSNAVAPTYGRTLRQAGSWQQNPGKPALHAAFAPELLPV